MREVVTAVAEQPRGGSSRCPWDLQVGPYTGRQNRALGLHARCAPGSPRRVHIKAGVEGTHQEHHLEGTSISRACQVPECEWLLSGAGHRPIPTEAAPNIPRRLCLEMGVDAWAPVRNGAELHSSSLTVGLSC